MCLVKTYVLWSHMALTISYLALNAWTIVKINRAEHNSTTLLSLVTVIRCYDICRSVFEHIKTHARAHAHTHKNKLHTVRANVSTTTGTAYGSVHVKLAKWRSDRPHSSQSALRMTCCCPLYRRSLHVSESAGNGFVRVPQSWSNNAPTDLEAPFTRRLKANGNQQYLLTSTAAK